MTAREYFTQKYGEPQTDNEKLTVVLMSAYAESQIEARNKVTPEMLDAAMRMAGLSFGLSTVKLILELVRLIEKHGDGTTMKHVLDCVSNRKEKEKI